MTHVVPPIFFPDDQNKHPSYDDPSTRLRLYDGGVSGDKEKGARETLVRESERGGRSAYSEVSANVH